MFVYSISELSHIILYALCQFTPQKPAWLLILSLVSVQTLERSFLKNFSHVLFNHQQLLFCTWGNVLCTLGKRALSLLMLCPQSLCYYFHTYKLNFHAGKFSVYTDLCIIFCKYSVNFNGILKSLFLFTFSIKYWKKD